MSLARALAERFEPGSRRLVAALGRWPTLTAALLFAAVAGGMTTRVLTDKAALGPDTLFDEEALSRVSNPAKWIKINDIAATVADLPRDLRVARALHGGHLDVWNPQVACGAPLWAEQGGPFFPLKLIVYLVPTVYSYNLFRVLRLLVVALGMFLLLRRRGLPWLACAAGGVLVETSGAMVGIVAFNGASSAFLVPWVVLSAEEIDRSGRAGAALGGIALGVAGLGGHPTMTLLTGLAFGLAVAGCALGRLREPRRLASLVGWSVVAGGIGFLIAAPSLLPLMELWSVGESYKNLPGSEVNFDNKIKQFNSFTKIALWAPRTLLGKRQTLGFAFPYAYAPAFGWITMWLALVGVQRRPLDGPRTLLGVIGVGLAVHPWGLHWLHSLPLLKHILPEYSWVLLAVAMALTAGDGLAALFEEKARRRAAIAFGVLLALALYMLFTEEPPPKLPPRADQPVRLLVDAVTGKKEPGAWSTLLGPPLIAMAVFVSAILVGWRDRWRRGRAGWALGASIVLCAGFAEQGRTMRGVFIDPPSLALRQAEPAVAHWLRTHLDHDGRMLADPGYLATPMTPLHYDLRDARQISALPVRRYKEFIAATRPRGVSATMFTMQREARALVDLAAVRYVLAPRGYPSPPTLGGDPELRLELDSQTLAIYRNHAAAPRVRIAHRVLPLADEAAAAAWARTVGASTTHAGEQGLLAVAHLEPIAGGPLPQVAEPPPDASESAVIVAETPERLMIDATLAAPGVLVIADTYYPGWAATVDGAPAAIYPADLLFRGVAVPAGQHRVELTYRCRPLRIGAALALFGLLACAALLVLRRGWPARRSA